ncbi:transketolase family protein [Bacteroidetes bacterium endosymbiont of Geopemphigus sp.]|uniref:transketolase family protein n=1 Tax=Bacteroidetes bacterium endosymbiont of Geopemphigus sp. TaxID=2047937 RepID=UPI000CD209D0|nr:transketolase C-terminal domain-containing protein [Bacteroidetes bacterium endosymbiont of Geopemphigus sp.]
MKIYKGEELKETRAGFGAALLELGKKQENIVALCADLTGSLSMTKFSETFPERFFQIGIAEAHMMGMAAGLAIGGYIPFTGTFANFSTARVYDQIRQCIAYSEKNVKICASHAGLTLGEDGATHQSLEDIGMMKMLPGMMVINTCDFNQTYAATLAIAKYKGPVYLRFGRPAVPNFTNKDQDFHLGKGLLLVEGKDVTIVCTGHLVWESLKAAKGLLREGVSCEVINIHTIKPLDEELILKSVSKTGCVVSAEEHNLWGGLGESIARLLSTKLPRAQEFVAVCDTFGESGKHMELMNKYNIDQKTLIEKVRKVIKRK